MDERTSRKLVSGKKGEIDKKEPDKKEPLFYVPKKITWDTIYQDFKQRHPHLAKDVIRWKPCGYLKITIYVIGGMELEYDYWFHKATIRKDGGR